MTFTTLTFALFLVVVFAVHWSTRSRVGQNLVILAASYVFYGWWDARFCALLLASSLLDYWVAAAIARSVVTGHRRWLLAISCVTNLGVLAVFKYFDFFADGFARALTSVGMAADFPTLHLILPVGISFYTFQTLGYTIDVYRGDVRASRSLLDYLAYVSFFPQLVAGPIERARNLLPQLECARRFDEADARDGARQMLWGLVKKVALADHLGVFVEQAYSIDGSVHAAGPVLAVATVAFALQIYCDFSAYSDIAVGTAKLFGVRLMRNFATPYFSRSVVEFWRRWHISLSSWFRDYVFVPLGGSRCGPGRRWLNLLVTFTLSGLWHGASWTFVVWGASNGVLVAASSGTANRSRELPSSLAGWSGLVALAQMLATFASICATWVFFRAVDLGHAWAILRRIVVDAFAPAAWADLGHHDEFLAGFAPLAALLVLVEWITRWHEHPLAALSRWPRAIRWALYTCLLWMTMYLMPDDPHAFIYFQF